MKRGEIHYIERSSYGETGSEQRSGRPAIIVSNDKCNEYSEVLEVVFLTTQPKNDLPTHIDIRSSTKPSVALCEQINSIAIQRFGEYIGTCSDYEMMMVDAALAISLGLEFEKKPEKKEEKKIEPKKVGGGGSLLASLWLIMSRSRRRMKKSSASQQNATPSKPCTTSSSRECSPRGDV